MSCSMDSEDAERIPAKPTAVGTSISSQLHEALEAARPFVLKPRAFFVSWSGVLTLAFTGWPPQAVALKRQLTERLGDAVRPENPGSRWPKITLGALREGRAALSLEELIVLSKICTDLSSHSLLNDKWEMEVHSLAQTLFAWPSHEWLISRFDIALPGAIDRADPDEDSKSYVQRVLAEGEDLEAYLPNVQKPGGISKYRSAAAGASLVAFASGSSGVLPDSLMALQKRVDEALPGTYDWMQPEALHCTLRALM